MISGPDVIMSMILILLGSGCLLIMLGVIYTAVKLYNKIIYELG